MHSVKAKLAHVLSLLRKRANLFYLLSFAPLVLIFYYTPFTVIVPFYGFLLLLLKYAKLLDVGEAGSLQKVIGSIVVVSSFFIHYVVILIHSRAAFYSAANYVVYLLGLFLVFFEFSALKEAFSPLFLIVASASSIFVAAWLKPFLSPLTNDFAHIVTNILRAFGISANVYSGNVPLILIQSISGKIIPAAFVYECIGIYSLLIFSIVLVVILFEDPSGWKVKLAYSFVGLLGTFVLNLLRVVIIFLTDYFYGTEVGGTIHYIMGYALFSTWLAAFFYIYAKRQILNAKIKSLYSKIR